MSNSKGIAYFFNNETKESSWEAPADLTEDMIKQLPGAQLLGAKPSSTAAPRKVRASHLLVKHSDSRRPSSWKDANITRSKGEAIEILRQYESQIKSIPEKSSETFKELATKHSDCSSHEAGGDLGWFGPGQMQKAFEEGTYALEIGQISDIVSSDSGVHLIMRTG